MNELDMTSEEFKNLVNESLSKYEAAFKGLEKENPAGKLIVNRLSNTELSVQVK